MPKNTSNAAASSATSDRLSILVVDDNAVDRRMITAACSGLDVRLEMASSGEEALEMYAKKPYRLVITDYMMEPMSGLDLAHALRKMNPEVELILVSGSPSAEVMAYVQDNDLSPVVTKPIMPKTLMECVALSLERFRGRKTVLSDIALSNRMDACLPLVGQSAACQELRSEVMRLLRSTKPIAISGVEGSGRLQLATLIHQEGVYGNSACVEYFCALGRDDPDAFISEAGVLGAVALSAENGTLIIHHPEALTKERQNALAQVFSALSVKTHLIILLDACVDTLLEDGRLEASLYFKLSLQTLAIRSLRQRVEDLPDMTRAVIANPQHYGFATSLESFDVDRFLESWSKGRSPETLAELIRLIAKFAGVYNDKFTL